MTLRFEIVSAGRGTAVVETYLDGRRTAMSERLPVAAARLRGEAVAGPGGEVVDHTRERGLADEIRGRAVERMDRGTSARNDRTVERCAPGGSAPLPPIGWTPVRSRTRR